MSDDDMHEKHLENVLAFESAEERYNYFVTTVCDADELFGLVADDHWVDFDDEDGRKAFPVWPHARLAELEATDEWAAARPDSIELDSWLAFCDRLAEDGARVAVMPYPDGSFVRVEPGDLKRDLVEWLSDAYDESRG